MGKRISAVQYGAVQCGAVLIVVVVWQYGASVGSVGRQYRASDRVGIRRQIGAESYQFGRQYGASDRFGRATRAGNRFRGAVRCQRKGRSRELCSIWQGILGSEALPSRVQVVGLLARQVIRLVS